jgi:ATP-binding cassette, subfamily B, bacterial PglK
VRVLKRIWRLLDGSERRSLVRLIPLVLLTAGFELIGVTAVIPFVTLLAQPQAVFGLPIVGPWIAASGVDDTTILLRYAGLTLAFAVLATNGMVMLTRYRQFRFAADLNYSMSSRLLGHYLSQPYAFTLTRNSATLTNTVMQQVSRVTQGVGEGLHIMTAGVTIVALLVFLIALDPLLALVSFGVLGGLYGGIFLITRNYLTRTSRELVDTVAERFKAVNEAMGGFKDLKVAGRERSPLRHYRRPARREARIRAAVNAIRGLPRYALEAIAVGGVVVIASLMAGREGAFTSTLPLLGAYLFGALRLMPAMQSVFGAVAALRNIVGAVEILEADLARGDESADALTEPPPPLAFERTVSLRGVSYRYPAGDGHALAAIDLEIAKGRSIGIVGRTGSGKTTLVNVLLGLLEPSDGCLEVDGRRVDASNRRAYRRLFGYVPQDIFLVDDTVRRNVALGIPDDEIDDEAVRRACRQAQVDDFIEQELAARLRHRGRRARRAPLGGPTPTHRHRPRALPPAPDPRLRRGHQRARRAHRATRVRGARGDRRERTLVMIAHRLETVAGGDHVIVLEGGSVIDEGSLPREVVDRYRLTATA